MQMPENFRCEENRLTIIVGELEYEFLEKDDFIRSDKKKILLKHHAIVELAQRAKISVGMPILLSSNANNCFVIAREAQKEDGTRFSAVGESNPQNLWSEYLEQYPAETADNRAYDRAVLGVVGVYGKIYSTSEFTYSDGEEKKKKNPAVLSSAAPEQKKEAVEGPKETEVSSDAETDLPIWWNDIGMGLYTDKQLDPETFIVTQGQCKDKNWTVKQLYDYKYDSCDYFASRVLENAPSEEFTKQVFSCRRAIRQYGIRNQKKSA